MPKLRIVLDPEAEGLGIPYDGELIHLANDAEIVVTGLPNGMSSGNPSMAFAFKLPSGDLVVAETSWRLFTSVYQAFLGKFGEPDMAGMQVGLDDGRVLEMVQSEKPFVECGHCDWRLDGENTEESLRHLLAEQTRHYQEEHDYKGFPTPGN